MLRKKEKVQTQRKRKGFKSLKFIFFFVFCLNLLSTGIFYTYKTTANAQDSVTKELDSLEEKVFHQSYKSESKEDRVFRLENFLFGGSSSKYPIEDRLKRITTALKTPETEQAVIKPNLQQEELKSESLDKTPLVQEPTNKEGIIGAINQIEMKLFNMTFNDYPFPARINALEDRLLQKKEIAASRTKPLLERVTILVSKAGLPVQKDNMFNLPVNETTNKNAIPQNNTRKSYSIDPNTGLLRNDQTGETVKDPDGNPISVMVPQAQQILPQQNYGYQPTQQNPLYQNNPYGNQFQQNQGGIPSPYDFLFNQQNNVDPAGSDPDY